jgi:hypothetical protein
MIYRLIILLFLCGDVVALLTPANINEELVQDFKEIMPQELRRSAGLVSDGKFDEAMDILKKFYMDRENFDATAIEAKLKEKYQLCVHDYRESGHYDLVNFFITDYLNEYFLGYFWSNFWEHVYANSIKSDSTVDL